MSGASRIPVSVLTGFLGSGKTTLLNRVLKTLELVATPPSSSTSWAKSPWIIC